MIRLEALTGRHDRKTFDSGVAPLDRWLQQTAMQHQQRGFARTFVAVVADDEACHALNRMIAKFHSVENRRSHWGTHLTLHRTGKSILKAWSDLVAVVTTLQSTLGKSICFA